MFGISKPHLGVVNISLDAIRPNSRQPRKEFDEESLDELANSIKNYGILQPIVVRRTGRNEYELIAGERRWRACQRAGLKEVPAIIKDTKDADTGILALIENIQREDLNFLEEAEGYKQLIQECGITQEELAEKLGKSQSAIANKLRVLKLSPQIIEIISREKLSERHARALLKLPDENLQLQALNKIVSENLTVRQTEEMIETVLGKLAASERGKGRIHPKEKSFKIAIKDVRIFVNSVRKLVKTVKDAGITADYSEVDKGEYIELTVKLPKNKI